MEGKFKWVILQWKSSGSFKMKFVHKALPNKSSEVTFSLNLSNFKLLQGGTIRYSTAFPCSSSKLNILITQFLKKNIKALDASWSKWCSRTSSLLLSKLFNRRRRTRLQKIILIAKLIFNLKKTSRKIKRMVSFLKVVWQ